MELLIKRETERSKPRFRFQVDGQAMTIEELATHSYLPPNIDPVAFAVAMWDEA